LLLVLALQVVFAQQDQGEFVFRSDVSLVRVDAQVVDRNNRAITGLRADDFILKEEGQPREIRNFAREDMPVDILLLLDVSGSMRPHIERVASASRQALTVLGPEDRVGIMVFDRGTRLRLPFRSNRTEVERGLSIVLQEETFDGGTDITNGLHEAARYVSREGRRDARRAIVILTDDQTERDRDDRGVAQALNRADAILSALLAPDAAGSGRVRVGSGGGGLPSDPLGGIIFGRRGPWGGRRMPGPVISAPRTRSAGTAEIARASGGDSLRVDEASALETSLTRIRQRYALHFNLPEGAQPNQERNIEVELASAARRRYPDAEVRFRRVYLAPASGSPAPQSEPPVQISNAPELKRRPAVDRSSGGSSGPAVLEPPPAPAKPKGGWRRADEPEPVAVEPAPEPTASKPGGWRRVKPGEQP
jgi:VWFA-related protein